MKIYIKYDINTTCRTIIKEQLGRLGIEHELKDLGELIIKPQPEAVLETLKDNLNRYGIELVLDAKSQLIQRIKNVIAELVDHDRLPVSKISHYISERLGMNYCYISTFFSENTHSSIERYIILQKIEKAKKLLLQELSLTEISYMLNYSSVAHLSGQFKKTTGLSPSVFKRIIDKRKNAILN